MKPLLVVTAVVEAGAGLGLLVAPSTLTRLLVGEPIDAPAGVVVARIAGAAVLALALTCWLARDEVAGLAVRGIVVPMLLYNCGAVGALVNAAIVGLHGMGLWPTAGAHTGLALWCLACLAPRPAATPGQPTPKQDYSTVRT